MEIVLLQEYAGSGLSSSSHDLSSHGLLARFTLLNTHPCTLVQRSNYQKKISLQKVEASREITAVKVHRTSDWLWDAQPQMGHLYQLS